MAAISTLNPTDQPPSLPPSSSPSATASFTACAQALSTPELLGSILSHLNQHSLGMTSRVNHYWLDESTRARMSSVMPVEEGISEGALSWLVTQLIQRPELAEYVKRLSFSGFFYEDEGLFRDVVVRSLLLLARRVSSVAFFDVDEMSYHRSLLELIVTGCPRLHSLDFFGVIESPLDDPSWPTSLRSFANLKHLSLPGYFLDALFLSQATQAASLLCKLESFAASEFGSVYEMREVVSWFLGNSHDSLKKLAISAAGSSETISWIYDTFQNLEDVELRLEDLHEDPVVDQATLLRLLALPKLRKIDFTLADSDGRDFFKLEIDLTGTQPIVVGKRGVSQRLMKKIRKQLKMAPE